VQCAAGQSAAGNHAGLALVPFRPLCNLNKEDDCAHPPGRIVTSNGDKNKDIKNYFYNAKYWWRWSPPRKSLALRNLFSILNDRINGNSVQDVDTCSPSLMGNTHTVASDRAKACTNDALRFFHFTWILVVTTVYNVTKVEIRQEVLQ